MKRSKGVDRMVIRHPVRVVKPPNDADSTRSAFLDALRAVLDKRDDSR